MELWDIYDCNGNLTGKTVAKSTPMEPGEFHMAMEAWIVDSSGRLLIQKRSHRCELLPGLWALTTGRIAAGETSLQGCVRELAEELGLLAKPEELHLVRRIVRPEVGIIWDVYLLRKDIPIQSLTLQADEVADARWVTRSQFRQLWEQGELVQYPEVLELLEAVCREAARFN